MTDKIKCPGHYVGHYPFEVNQAIALILNSPLCDGLTPEQYGQLYAELKYRFRAGLKPGNSAENEIAKAMRFGEMRHGTAR